MPGQAVISNIGKLTRRRWLTVRPGPAHHPY
jgi:hypothetical protein